MPGKVLLEFWPFWPRIIIESLRDFRLEKLDPRFNLSNEQIQTTTSNQTINTTMKISALKCFTLNLALTATLAMLAGCASTADKGVATSTALSSTAEAVAQTSTSVNGVLASLNNLTFKSQGDLRNQFDAFVSASKNLDSAAARLDSRVAALQSTAAAYLNNWTNQAALIQNEELRLRSTERKNEVSTQLDEVTASYDAVRSSLTTFRGDVRDIQTFLGTDLTAGGLAAVKDIVSKTKVDAVPLRDSIKKLQGSFSSLSAALSPMMPNATQK